MAVLSLKMRLIHMVIIICLIALGAFAIYFIVVLFSNTGGSLIQHTTPLPDESLVIVECHDNPTTSDPCFGLVMIRRGEWLAEPGHNLSPPLPLPTKSIVVSDTKTVFCSEQSKCKYLVRNIQDDHIAKYGDIKYNFLISTEGDIYEGRGWLRQSGNANQSLAERSYWIAFIGNYTTTPTSEKQDRALRRFRDTALQAQHLATEHDYICLEEDSVWRISNDTDSCTFSR